MLRALITVHLLVHPHLAVAGGYATATDWGSAVSQFTSSSLGSTVAKALTAIAVVGIIIGVVMAVVEHHKMGLGKVIRRIFEVITLGVIVATPVLWGPIAGFVATLIGDAATWISGIL